MNSVARSVDARDPDMPLLCALRSNLGLYAARFGCGPGQCGACTVLVDSLLTRSCVLRIAGAAGRRGTAADGLGSPDRAYPVQAAFNAERAAQCGHCNSGMILSLVGLLA